MYYDISPLISADSAVYPGDEPFNRKVVMDMDQGDHLGLSSISTTVHIGAHADAPSHYGVKAEGIEQRDLALYIGGAQVVEVKVRPGERIQVEDVNLSKITEKRVLFKTDSFPDPNQWRNDFNSLSPKLLEKLAHQGVFLVGIDTPSVDPWDSKALESHQMLLAHDMAVLEGLVLKDVPEGVYKLSALPLKIKDADASPVRAALFSSQDWERL